MSGLGINRSNYQQYAHSLEHAYRREGASFGHPGLMSGTARRLGNVYSEFGDAESACEWYERAIELMRTQRPEPTIAVAFILWRMGESSRLEQECRAIIADREARVPGLRAALDSAGPMEHDDALRRATIASEELACAHLYLREFDEVVRTVDESCLVGVEARYLNSLRDLARALAFRDQAAFDGALKGLRAMTEPWPTFESNSVIDCYRLALALGLTRFGEIPKELEAELLASG